MLELKAVTLARLLLYLLYFDTFRLYLLLVVGTRQFLLGEMKGLRRLRDGRVKDRGHLYDIAGRFRLLVSGLLLILLLFLFCRRNGCGFISI